MLLATGTAERCLAEDATAPVVFSVLYNQQASSPFQEDWLILTEYASRMNVHLDVSLGDDEGYLDAVTRTLDAGNAPDIILKVWPDTIESYSISGALLAFSDYEHLMPYFTAYIDAHNLATELDRLKLANGKYYILPGYQRAIQVQQWVYRRDIFEANGLGIPATYDDLFTSLVALKALYPDATPLTACWGGQHLFAMMGAGYGIPAGWAGTRYYDPEEDRWLFAPATESYRELYRFLNRCYEAGVLDPGVFTQSDAEYYEKMLDGRALVTVTWISSGFQSWNRTLQENGFPNAEWAALPVPESTIGIRALPAVDPFRKGLIVSSRVINEPYFEDLLTFLDWAVYSEEGMALTTWGVEGITFETMPDGTRSFLPQIQTTKNPDAAFEMTNEYGLATLFNLNEDPEFEDQKKPEHIVAFLERSLAAGETLALVPRLVLGANALEATAAISGLLYTPVADAGQKFVTGQLSIDADWEGYIRSLMQSGYLTLEAIWNEAWEEQNN